MDGPASSALQQPVNVPAVEPPLGILAELTHRCPLQCPYCSNPLKLLKAAEELDTGTWLSTFDQAASLGVLQVHLSGGEPCVRQDLEVLVARLAKRGVYTNLITSGVTLTRDRVQDLADEGLDHVQLSIQGVDPGVSDRIGNYKNSLAKKLAAARFVKETGLPLTLNAPTHRHNIEQTTALIELALELGAERLEIAHVQYYGWAEHNKAALMPDYGRVLEEAALIGDAKERLLGVLAIDYVTPDHYAQFPKPCMGGWGSDVITVTPAGKVLPCHAAASLPLSYENVRDMPLSDIWYQSPSFNRFRGLHWMQEPCVSCPRKLIDFGGCRCQAFAVTGNLDATDPACSLSQDHDALTARASALAGAEPSAFLYRRLSFSQS